MRANPGGIVLIVIGVVLLLSNLGLFAWMSLSKLWPLILVAVGAMMLFPRRSS